MYYYRKIPNFGDLLSINIIEKLFGKKVVFSPPGSCDLISIGSILEKFLFNKRNRGLKYLFAKYFSPELEVWGSGFIESGDIENDCFTRKMHFFALRGKLSIEETRRIYKKSKNLDEMVLGDPGILSSFLIDRTHKKKYSLGIIPHFIDQNDPLIEDLKNRIKGSIVIDVCKDPTDTIQRISECELVISSAMHGLIAADSMNIPNMRIKVSDGLIGGDFKFRDYYSVYDTDIPEPMDLRKHRFTEADLPRIEGSYKIKQDDVTRIKNELIDAFPFK